MTVLNTRRMLAALAALVALACDSSQVNGPPEPMPVAMVAVTAPAPTVMVGHQLTLVATPRAADGDVLDRAVSWSSHNLQRATVAANGTVTALAPGTVRISATSEGRTGSVDLTVTPVPPAAVADVRLSVDEEVELAWNGAMQLHATALDADGNELPARPIEWLTTKPNVVTITETGMLRAVSAGTATVTAVIEGVASSVGVRVLQAPVAEVLIDAGETGLEIGETVFYAARLRTAAGDIITGAVTWTSSAPHIASVGAPAGWLGAVSAIAAGAVTITARSGDVSASLALRVTPKPTHDLVYSRSTGAQAELYVLSLATLAAAPVKLNAGNVSRDPSPSPDGRQIAFAVSQIDLQGNQQDDLYIVNRDGTNMRWLTRTAGMESQPAWSPDGTKILFQATGADFNSPNLWLVNVDGTGLVNVTAAMPNDVTDKRHPAWSPDGGRIAFIAARGGQHTVWTINSDGTGAAPLMSDAGFDATPTWSPTGDRIAFSRYNSGVPAHGWDIMIVSAAGGAATRLALPGDQLVPAWSPDGEYIAVSGTAVAGVGVSNLYTLRPDGTGLRLRTVNPAWGGGNAPAWIVRQ